jgi:hypothetical protein
MKLTAIPLRRAVAATAIAGAAILLPAVALASSAGTTASTASTASTAATASAAVHRCLRSELTGWLGIPAGQTAGSTYYELQISNISSRTCTLYGYPGVSAARGTTQLGSPADRNPEHPSRLLTLAPGSTVHAILRITDVGALPGCKIASADLLRVYAPNDFGSMTVPLSFQACANKGPIFLHVTTTVAGAGIPGYSF